MVVDCEKPVFAPLSAGRFDRGRAVAVVMGR
jgi:hypothetical protein